MVALPPIESAAVSAIYAAYQDNHDEFDSIGLSISALGGECDRALWMAFRWASEPEACDGPQLRRLRAGREEERRLIQDLRVAGVMVEDVDRRTGGQFKVYAIGGHLRGKMDGLATNVPEAPRAVHVLECHSVKDKAFRELRKHGVAVAAPGKHAQAQLYMHLRGHQRAYYLAVNRNDDSLYGERLRYDLTFAVKVMARVERVITATRPPPRIADNAEAWPCLFCRQKAVCHGADFARVNCRTCLHSTPIIDDDNRARWRCEHHGRELSFADQRNGCGDHLYIPDLVPGEQVNASEEGRWVDYQLANGAAWRDGAAA